MFTKDIIYFLLTNNQFINAKKQYDQNLLVTETFVNAISAKIILANLSTGTKATFLVANSRLPYSLLPNA